MARVQAQYSPRGTGLQQVVAPQIAMVAPQRPVIEESNATRLARALGVLNPGQIGQAIGQIQAGQEDTARRDATSFANSLTVDELGKRVRSGELPASQSPVFNATVQHIYGENYRATLERDVLSKMASGELKFTSEQEVDEYLTKSRNDFLKGQSEYTTAGFDKGWNDFRARVIGINTKITDKEAVDRGVQEASDNLSNALIGVVSADFKGGVPEQAAALMKRYELLTATHLLRDDARKDALSNLMVRIAGSGNTALLNEMLAQKLPNNGPSVAAVLGDRAALTLTHTAEATFDRDQRQRVDVELAPFLRSAHEGQLDMKALETFRQRNEKYVTSQTIESLIMADQSAKARIDKANALHAVEMQSQAIIYERTQQAQALVAGRRGHEMPDFEVPTGDGTKTKTIKGSDIVAQEVERRVAADPNMTFDEQVRLYSNNSVENKRWAADLAAAYVNIGEVGIDAKGKPVGQLLPATLEALDRFKVINSISTGYARDLVGGEKKYDVLVNIQALREGGVADPNLAASLVNQSERNVGANVENINTQVHKAVTAITDPGVFSSRFWSEVFAGEWGDGDKNIRSIERNVRSLAKAYMMAGVSSTGEEAVKKAVEYYSNPAVTVQINNTIYGTKDLPRVPDRQDQRFWFQRYMDEEVSRRLAQQGIKASASDIVLQPMLGGEPRYMVHLNGTPIGEEILRRDVEKWIELTDKKDIEERIKRKNEKVAPQDAFLIEQTPGGAAMVQRRIKR